MITLGLGFLSFFSHFHYFTKNLPMPLKKILISITLLLPFCWLSLSPPSCSLSSTGRRRKKNRRNTLARQERMTSTMMLSIQQNKENKFKIYIRINKHAHRTKTTTTTTTTTLFSRHIIHRSLVIMIMAYILLDDDNLLKFEPDLLMK